MDQKIEAKGRVVRDPELKKTTGKRSLLRITIAADEVSRNGEALHPETNKWQTAVFWGKEAEDQSREIRRGMLVRLSGEEVSRQYETKDGSMKEITELHDATIERLEPRMEVKGSLSRDPELRTTTSGDPIVRISIAADEVKKEGVPLDPEENKWHTAVFFGAQAERYAELKKGAYVQLTGDLVTREYEGKDGSMKTSQEIQRGGLEVVQRENQRGKGGPLPAGPSRGKPGKEAEDISR